MATDLLNMQTACKYVTKGDEDIHLSIQCDLICLNRAIPSVDLSKQLLERVRCVKNANTGVSNWMSLLRDQFGITSVIAFKSTGTVNRDILCDHSVKPPPPKQCPPLLETYEIDASVIIRCTWEMCGFRCPKGQQLNVAHTNVFCFPKENDDRYWLPAINEKIKCVLKEEDKAVFGWSTKCGEFPNKIESDVTVSCNKKKCRFKCEYGKPNVSAATCFKGKWNVNKKIVIICKCGKKCQKKKAQGMFAYLKFNHV